MDEKTIRQMIGLGGKPKERSKTVTEALGGKPKDESRRWSASAPQGGEGPPPLVMARNALAAKDRGLTDGMDAKDTSQHAGGR